MKMFTTRHIGMLCALVLTTSAFATNPPPKPEPPKPTPTPQPITIDTHAGAVAQAEADARAAAIAAQQQQQHQQMQQGQTSTNENRNSNHNNVGNDNNISTEVGVDVDVDATGGQATVKDSGNSSVEGSGNSQNVITVEGDEVHSFSMTPHAPLVPMTLAPTLFEHTDGANGVSVPYVINLMEKCTPVFSSDKRMKPIKQTGKSGLTKVTFVPYSTLAYSGAKNPSVVMAQAHAASGTQRFRCLGRLSVEGLPKKAEYAFLDTLVWDAMAFANKRLTGETLGLEFNSCAISINKSVMTFGSGTGASAGGSNVWDSILGTLSGGLSLSKGRTLNFNQIGATYVVVTPTTDEGPGTFTLADLAIKQPESEKAKVAAMASVAPPAAPGDLNVK